MSLTASAYVNRMLEEVPLTERMDRIADAGFEAIDFNFYKVDNWKEAGQRAKDRGLNVVYTTDGITSMTDPNLREEAIADAEELIERAAWMGATYLHPPVGEDQEHLSRAEQHDSIVAVLGDIADIAAEAGIEIVLEPRTHYEADWYYLHTAQQGYDIIDDLDHPNVSLILDIYHEQMEVGNLINNIRKNIEYISHVHCSDVPTSGPPGTGEINYENVFAALSEVGYDGHIALEFDPKQDLAAYQTEFQSMLDRASR